MWYWWEEACFHVKQIPLSLPILVEFIRKKYISLCEHTEEKHKEEKPKISGLLPGKETSLRSQQVFKGLDDPSQINSGLFPELAVHQARMREVLRVREAVRKAFCCQLVSIGRKRRAHGRTFPPAAPQSPSHTFRVVFSRYPSDRASRKRSICDTIKYFNLNYQPFSLLERARHFTDGTWLCNFIILCGSIAEKVHINITALDRSDTTRLFMWQCEDTSSARAVFLWFILSCIYHAI